DAVRAAEGPGALLRVDGGADGARCAVLRAFVAERGAVAAGADGRAPGLRVLAGIVPERLRRRARGHERAVAADGRAAALRGGLAVGLGLVRARRSELELAVGGGDAAGPVLRLDDLAPEVGILDHRRAGPLGAELGLAAFVRGAPAARLARRALVVLLGVALLCPDVEPAAPGARPPAPRARVV